MSLVHTASRPYLKLGDHQSQKNWPQLMVVDVCEINITYDNDENLPNSIEMPLSNKKFFSVTDGRTRKLRTSESESTMAKYSDFYKIENNILYRMVVENNHSFDAAVLPAELINTALFLGHNQSGTQWFPEDICSYQMSLLLEG